MKNIFITTLIIICAAGVHAQAGMPKELSCTETAFNFSFGLGAKWKFITPKMGPVQVAGNQPDLTPGWAAKFNGIRPETNLRTLPGSLGSSIYQQSQVSAGFKVVHKPAYLLPGIDFNFPINYTFSSIPATLSKPAVY